MDARLCEDTKQLVEKEIDTIVNKDELTPTDLEYLGELVDIIKDLGMIDKSSQDMPQGMSGGVMPYWGQIAYTDTPRGRGGSSYRSNYDSQGRMNYDMRGNSGTGSSYGRYYDDGRMMGDQRVWM